MAHLGEAQRACISRNGFVFVVSVISEYAEEAIIKKPGAFLGKDNRIYRFAPRRQFFACSLQCVVHIRDGSVLGKLRMLG